MGLTGCMECDKGRLTGIADDYRCHRCAALSAALARAEAAERLAVWAVRHGAFIDCEIPDVQAVFAFWPDERFEGEPDMDLCENTDADLLRALKEASGID